MIDGRNDEYLKETNKTEEQKVIQINTEISLAKEEPSETIHVDHLIL